MLKAIALSPKPRLPQVPARLYLPDLRMLPGMEGGPVVSPTGALIGALWLPMFSDRASAQARAVVDRQGDPPFFRTLMREGMHASMLVKS